MMRSSGKLSLQAGVCFYSDELANKSSTEPLMRIMISKHVIDFVTDLLNIST